MAKYLLAVLWSLTLCKGDVSFTSFSEVHHNNGIAEMLHRYVPRSLQDTITGLEDNKFCSTWGNGAFRTFDDKFYHFTSTCNYILSRHCASGTEDFSIQIRRGSNGNLEHIYIKIEELKILVVNGTISVQDVIVTVPFDDKVISIQPYGIYTRIYNRKHTISLIWNHQDAISLTLDSSYQGQLCGLCGKFEKGSSTVSGPDFYDLNKLDVLGHTCSSQPTDVSSCLTNSQCIEGISSTLLSCFDNTITQKYINLCNADSCTCKKSNCECATFEEMARHCNKAILQFHPDWKTKYTKCINPECPATQIYKECGPACVPTCSNSKPQLQCDQCVNTCDCPKGTVLDNIRRTSTCIKKADCPCEYDGKIYASGMKRIDSCQSCTCESGAWSCSHLRCPGKCKIEEATCITTFDNNYYRMIGDCSYDAVVTVDWTIKVEIHQCQQAFKQTCLQRVTLTNNQTSFMFSNDGKVHFDGNAIAIPLRTGGITIFQQSSMFIQVATTFGLKMQVQILPVMQLYISLSEDFKESTKGLCGVFNDKADDDFLSRGGIVESTPITFVNSWKIQDSCPDAILPPPCVSSENEKYAKDNCNSIKDPNGAFSVCHSAVDPALYYQMCVDATCACENINDCLCAGLGAYVHECAAHGIFMRNWRGKICSTPPCANTQVFENDMRACNRTCRSLSEYDYTCTVKDVPVYGCGCPEGKYMDNTGACIDKSDCSCYIGDTVIKTGQSVTLNGRTCTCENGKPYCSTVPVTTSPGCLNGKVYFDCRNVDVFCGKTCKGYNKSCSNERCIPGCVCPDNLVEDEDGKCITPEKCSCSYGGESYAPGITIPKDCNNCTCKAGTWECTKNTCPKECLIYGDGHYATFDGKRYRYDGNCEYVLVEDRCNKGSGTIQILIESVPCCERGVTCSRNIRILFEGIEFKLTDGRVIRAVLPRDQFKCRDEPYSIHTVGLYLILTFTNGVTVIWDKRTRVSITLDPRWKNKVCGLCGNFNGNVADDLTTKENSLVTNTLEFGNSWKSSLSCSNAINQTFPCDRNPYCLSWAQRKCSIIKDAVFQKCHKKVDPTPFYDACIQEACACDLEGKYLGFCTAVAVYAEACNKAGVCVRWRTPDMCPVYCDYYNNPDECSWHYHPCGKSTPKTCSDHYVGKKFSAILEGCYAKCPEKAPYLDENIMKCVKLPDCTCYYNGKVLQPGEVIRTHCKECHCWNGIVECVSGNSTTTIYTTASTPEATTTPKGTTTTVIEKTTTTKGFTTTVKSATTGSTTGSTPEVTTTTVTPATTSSTTISTPEVITTPKGTSTTTVIGETTTTEVITTPKATTTAVISETTTTAGVTITVKPPTIQSTTGSTPEVITTPKTTATSETTTTEVITTPKATTTAVISEKTTTGITTTVKPPTIQSTTGSTPEGVTTSVKPSTTGTTPGITPEVITTTVTPTTTSSTTISTPERTSVTKVTTTGPTAGSTTEVVCLGYWSPWFNENTPSVDSPGDSELLDPKDTKYCNYTSEVITNIQCQFVDQPERPFSDSQDNVTCDKDKGLTCVVSGTALEQKRICYDYQVRVCCEPVTPVTTTSSRTTSTSAVPSTTQETRTTPGKTTTTEGVTTSVKPSTTGTSPGTTPEVITTPKVTTTAVISEKTTTAGITTTVKPPTIQSTTGSTPVVTTPKTTATSETTTEVITTPKATTTTVTSEKTTTEVITTPKTTATSGTTTTEVITTPKATTTAVISEKTTTAGITTTVKPITTQSTTISTPEVITTPKTTATSETTTTEVMASTSGTTVKTAIHNFTATAVKQIGANTTTGTTTATESTSVSKAETTTVTKVATTGPTAGSTTEGVTTSVKPSTTGTTPGTTPEVITTTVTPTTTSSTTISTPERTSVTKVTTTGPTAGSTTEVVCLGYWSPWFNENTPSVDSPGDSELLDPKDTKYCNYTSEVITNIQCQFVDQPERPFSDSQDNVTCDKDKGLTCVVSGTALEQKRICYDYQVRVCCEPVTPVTTTSSRTTSTSAVPSTTQETRTTPGKTTTTEGVTTSVKPSTTGTTPGITPEVITTTVTPTTTSSTTISTPERTSVTKVTTTGPTAGSTTEVVCLGYWSPWFNENTPSVDSPGDSELLDPKDTKYCNYTSEVITNIQCQFVDQPERPFSDSQDNVTCDKDKGLTCVVSGTALEQKRICYDYQVRVCCEPVTPVTTTSSRTTSTSAVPSTTQETRTTPGKTTTTEGVTTSVKPSTTGTTPGITPEVITTTVTPTTTSSTTISTPERTSVTKVTTTGPTAGSTTVPPTTQETGTTPGKTTAEVTTTTVTPTTTGSTTISTPEVTPTTKVTTVSIAHSTTAAPPTQETSTTPGKTTTTVICNGVWSVWLNENTPSISNKNDVELLKSIREKQCPIATHKVSQIECEAVKFPQRPIGESKDNVTCDVEKGLMCTFDEEASQKNIMCLDYRIRVCCEPVTFTTPSTVSPTTAINSTTSEAGCYCNQVPRRKCHETWEHHCSKITCLGGNTYLMENITCPSLPSKPKCRNGLEPVKVQTNNGCCEKWECDCQCEVWGEPHYRTFDDLQYDFFENCTYILVEEKVPKYNFRILVDNYFCLPSIPKSCPKGLVVSYNGIDVTISTGDEYVLTVNKKEISLPYSANGFEITKLGIITYISIPDIRTSITAFQNAFRIRVPEQFFLDNTQGQCGSCSHSPSICTRKNGKVESLDCCSQTAYDWRVYDPKKPYCQLPPPDVPCTPTTPAPTCKPEETICDIIAEKPFEECSKKIDLGKYIKTCHFDHCQLNSTVDCSSLEAAAMACASVGICVNWRPFTNEKCNYPCGRNLVYNFCQKREDDSCVDQLVTPGRNYPIAMEGCFCPEGMMLAENNTKCVATCDVCKPILHMEKIVKGDCEANVKVNQCEGTCFSITKYNYDINALQHICQCCHERETEEKSVKLQCKNGTTKTHTYTDIKSCICKIV
ncbi:mucin-2-like isoform X2 [Scyliorhinus canicula]|uniref:mucin-2-like isoform X2 n=1 Tax=Scyliorhinus canicula TaxID=7830 RepID=UPI0018F46D89|nr:mucin-2-like isoform X2 [Scyliorhinus canicula]